MTRNEFNYIVLQHPDTKPPRVVSISNMKKHGMVYIIMKLDEIRIFSSLSVC